MTAEEFFTSPPGTSQSFPLFCAEDTFKLPPSVVPSYESEEKHAYITPEGRRSRRRRPYIVPLPPKKRQKALPENTVAILTSTTGALLNSDGSITHGFSITIFKPISIGCTNMMND